MLFHLPDFIFFSYFAVKVVTFAAAIRQLSQENNERHHRQRVVLSSG